MTDYIGERPEWIDELYRRLGEPHSAGDRQHAVSHWWQWVWLIDGKPHTVDFRRCSSGDWVLSFDRPKRHVSMVSRDVRPTDDDCRALLAAAGWLESVVVSHDEEAN